jgi:hypothetical protein
VPKEYYWRVREKLNIWAEARAICEGEAGKFLVDKDSRARVAQNCSLILICEKKTVSAELLAALRKLGYRVNLISTGGHSASDVQEAVMQATADLDSENPTFYIIVLHDYDLDGVRIYFTLKQRYDNVIDAGVNRGLIDYLKSLGNFDSRLVEEQRLNRAFQGELKATIEEGGTAYTVDDFEYLQGELEPTQGKKKQWRAHRIEIDSIHVKYGIEPFVKYIVKKIETECLQWDLTRIGMTEFDLEEPSNPYHDALDRLNQTISEAHSEAWTKICKPLLAVDHFVADVTSEYGREISSLLARHSVKMIPGMKYEKFNIQAYELNSDELANLKTIYGTGFAKKYLPNHEDELEILNAKVTCYEGDVTTAIEDLASEHEDLQGEVDSEAENDEDAMDFEDSLNELDWGKEEFAKLTMPDEKDVIRTVINRLQERLAKLEASQGGK